VCVILEYYHLVWNLWKNCMVKFCKNEETHEEEKIGEKNEPKKWKYAFNAIHDNGTSMYSDEWI